MFFFFDEDITGLFIYLAIFVCVVMVVKVLLSMYREVFLTIFRGIKMAYETKQSVCVGGGGGGGIILYLKCHTFHGQSYRNMFVRRDLFLNVYLSHISFLISTNFLLELHDSLCLSYFFLSMFYAFIILRRPFFTFSSQSSSNVGSCFIFNFSLRG